LDEERIRRIAKNEALFRAVNERVGALNETFEPLTGRIVIVCECGAQTCIEQIDLSRAEYERIRSQATQFAVRPGHIFEDVEHVSERHENYWLVRKDAGEATKLAEELDTRTH
jgi:hypothetical protein